MPPLGVTVPGDYARGDTAPLALRDAKVSKTVHARGSVELNELQKRGGSVGANNLKNRPGPGRRPEYNGSENWKNLAPKGDKPPVTYEPLAQKPANWGGFRASEADGTSYVPPTRPHPAPAPATGHPDPPAPAPPAPAPHPSPPGTPPLPEGPPADAPNHVWAERLAPLEKAE
ncbi:hypothetical protein EIP91_004229 [Steccherinum ochraceum]|uniref:Uncharacterized protein n=1 Tax=Steccherinum ochraceum TaxID=92696 RepID=A0A4R0R983_9APHY|nr:hypothetical protein EIP91_004229 [Steccherinum ochraceum]